MGQGKSSFFAENKKEIIQLCAITALLIFILLGFALCASEKKRFVYEKSAFQGKILDNETKEPIEGVVVVAIYWEFYSWCPNPAGCEPSIAGIVETRTDKKGGFYLKPFKTWMGPFGYAAMVDFIIYKPGYASYPASENQHPVKPLDIVKPEYFFAHEVGSKGLVKSPALAWQAKEKMLNTVEITFGIVEMPKIYEKEQRLRAIPDRHYADYISQELPFLNRAIWEELFNFREMR